MGRKHRKIRVLTLLAAVLMAAAAAVLSPGCLPARKTAQGRAPVVDTGVPSSGHAYWRAKYTRNRMVPPEQYSLMPAGPRNNGFGEFDDGMYSGLDRQPSLPPLPGDGWDGMMMAGGAYAGNGGGGQTLPATRAPAGPASGSSGLDFGPKFNREAAFAAQAPAPAPQGVADGTHFYPVEQLVYGGDYGELDNPDAYRLMPRDEISVTVRDHPEFSGKLVLQPDGTVRIPNTPDPIHLRGRTTAEAADAIRNGIAVYVKGECAVRVQANRARGGYYFVFGDVKQPGRFPMGMEPVRLSDAVMAANFEANPNRLDEDEELGPAFPAASPRGAFVTPATADMARVMLITPHRSQPARTTHDLRQAMLGMTAGDPLVRPGQIIVVPSLDPAKNLSLGLDMPARPVPPAPVLRQGQGFSTADSPARLPEILPYEDDFGSAGVPARASDLEVNLTHAYGVQSTEEATRVNEFPAAEEYIEEYIVEEHPVLYEEEVVYEEPAAKAIVVESVDPVLPDFSPTPAMTPAPARMRGRRLRKAPFADTLERAVAAEPAGGWEKGF